MSYVIAFENDGTARDVTTRYVKAYNAKTRKNRVEITKGGEIWWRKVLELFDRPYDLDRDQVEDAELAAKEAAEEMPRNVQDFKDHPYYALERHLRRSEVIHPKREVGKVTAGKAGASGTDKTLESIYRRRDVHVVKSADSWYRLGREIKPGEQPLKRVQARRCHEARLQEDDPADEDKEGAGMGLYTPFQTVTYEAPPVVNGRIPKNGYGNLDIYVPTMVPKGGVHIVHAETARAAKILGIDYADAVTGFEFRGRHGTALIKGAVVATEYAEAVQAVISGFEDQRVEAEELRKSHEAVRMWKRFMIGLRIKERIEGYDVEGERDVAKEELEKLDGEMEEEEGGGFMPERDEVIAEPTVRRSYYQYPTGSDGGGGFLPESPVEGAQQDLIQREDYVTRDARFQAEDIGASGFLSDAIDEDAEEALRAFEGANTRQHDVRNTSSQVPPPKQPGGKNALATEDEEHGGGFLVDEDIANSEPTPLHTLPMHPTTSAFGLSDHELDEATMLQQMHENTNENAVDAEMVEHEVETPVQGPKDMEGDESVLVSSNGQQPAAEVEAVVSDVGGSDDLEDRGSLLSHDPEDEDAEPEWLASD